MFYNNIYMSYMIGGCFLARALYWRGSVIHHYRVQSFLANHIELDAQRSTVKLNDEDMMLEGNGL